VRVSLFITCYNDTLFPATGQAVVRLLERLGHTIDFPLEQTCCGQMHYNTGYQQEAMPLMRRFVEIFRDSEAVCIPSSSCVAMIRDHYPKMAAEQSDPGLARAVDELLPRVYEMTELLVHRFGLEDVGAYFPHRVTYHAKLPLAAQPASGRCATAAVTKSARHRAGRPAQHRPCCGFGGTFAIKMGDVSAAMLAEKMKDVENTGAEVITAVDTSCLMHIFGGLHRQRAGVRMAHIAEILAPTEKDEGAGA
jgi:L-lactate dehydrogenase complex protein LldE